jgi:BlaI family transcriptional regulator, penicillinase repressor
MAKLPRISDAEWTVMAVLWEDSPRTAGEVVDALAGKVTWSAATIKTMLNRLVRKRALRFKTDGKRYLYWPAVSRDACMRSETRSLVDRLFGGATGALLAHFVEDARLSRAEIDELRRLLDRKRG